MRKFNNKGNATVLSVAICLAIILVMCVIFEYMQMLIITTGIRNAVESATVSTVVANYDEAYSQLREGYSGGFVYQDTDCSRIKTFLQNRYRVIVQALIFQE